MLRPLPAPARDVAVLVARVLLGVVLFAHGYQKYFQYGLGGASASFARMGVPLPPVSAFYAATVELVGGALLIVGAATTIVSVLVVLDMIGASIFAGSITHGVILSASNHGWELEGMILAAAVLLLVTGAGRYSVDHLLLARRDAPLPAPA